MSRLWMVRLGRHGEYEDQALEQKLLQIDFAIESDISHLNDRAQILALMEKLLPDAKPKARRSFAAQVNMFVNTAAVGDLVVSPMKTTWTIALGRFAGPYLPGPNGEVRRPVEWIKTDWSYPDSVDRLGLWSSALG